jgi:putative Holliday junction resolvase
MRMLGIDYGNKRIGLAVSDRNEKLASCFLTLENKSLESSINKIRKIIAENNIEKVIIGIPVGFKGESRQAKKTREFAIELKKETNLPIIEINEIFTSKMAKKNLLNAGINSKEFKKNIDQEAARIILQDYLDRRHFES